MKKDVFMIWLKEFCSLIFTQSVQAFLLAIIMSVIVSTASNNEISDQGSAASATGLIAIIALASLSKIELLVKKIFGVESQFGDPSMKNGAGALAGSLIAAKMASRALNNVPKIMGGAKGAVIDPIAAKRRALGRQARNLAAANGRVSEKDKNAFNNAGGSNTSGDIGDAGYNSNSQSGNTTTIGNGGDATASTGGNNTGKLTAEKYYKIQDEYDKAMSERNKSRNESLKKMVSGSFELASMPLGALAGGTVAAAMGDPVLKGAGVGIGVTDYMAEKLVDTASAAMNLKDDFQAIGKAGKSATEAIDSLNKSFNGPNSKKIDSYREAKQIQRDINIRIKREIDVGKM